MNAAEQGSGSFFQTLVEHSLDLITVVDRDSRILYQNPAVTRVLGQDVGALIGVAFLDLVHPDDVERARVMCAEVTGTPGASVAGEHRFRHREGGWRVLECRARNLLGRAEVGGVVISARDVTERRGAEEALEDSETRLRAVVSTAPIVLFSLDREGRFTFSDGHGLEALGLKPGQVVGQNVYDSFGNIPGIREHIERAMRGETVRYTATFGDLYYDTMYAPHYNQRGEVDGIIGVSLDVTEQRRLELQFLQAQKMEAIGRLAGGVAHDFNNLVTAILGYTDLLQDSFDPQDPRRADLTQVARAAQRAADLTRQLLTFARRQASTTRLIDLNESLRYLEKMLSRLVGDNIQLVTELAPDLWQVRTDPAHVEQLVLNLAINARDAMPQGGRLVLRTANVEAGEGRTPAGDDLEPGSYVRLSVSDTGVGLAPEAIAHLFEPFFTTKEPGKGTGLGLATCYGLVKQARGHIAASSQPGVGTTFTVWLPRARPAGADQEEIEEAAVQLAQGSETILLVEDDTQVREVTERTLRQLGYETLSTSDAGRAIELAQRHPGRLDLLLTDLSMPQLGGRDLAAQLRKRQPHLRVVYVTAYADEALQEELASEGTRVLWKPFTREGLARTIRDALDESPRSRRV